jgi:hypothetical protein
MFDSKQTLTDRFADAFDLLLDFATLGEYGLEPVAKAAPTCEPRRRSGQPSYGARRSVDRGFAAHH